MYHRITTVLVAIIAVESILVMTGWILGIDAFTRILPQGINMKFPTALLFFLSSIALYYISREIKDHLDISQVILPGIALFIFLITMTLLAAGFSNIQTGTENLFVNPESNPYSWGAGWPSIFTMISFFLFGLAIIVSLFPEFNRKKWLKILGSCIFLIGLTAALGYVFNQPVMYNRFNPSITPTAFNTALTFILLGSGLITIGKSKKNK